MRKNRRKMKSVGAVLLTVVLLCGLTACGGSGKEREWKTEFSSTDWKTLEFSLDGRICTFPVSCADLEAVGYRIDKATRQEWLEAGYYTTGIPMENEAGVKIYVRFKNFGEKDQRLKDCDVYGLTFSYSDYEDDNPEVILCNGVTFGMTSEEVKALMGEPYSYSHNVDDSFETVYVTESMEYYVTDSVWESKIEFSFLNEALYKIDIRNTD